MPELSIILVNWNCLDFTMQCLASIQETITDISYEVIVVENRSKDAPCRRISEQYPSVRLILSAENLGFGGANNVAAHAATGEVLFFLNPDTILSRGAVREAYRLIGSRPDAGIVGCRFLNPDGSLQMSSVQAFPTIANQLLASRWLQRRFPGAHGKRALYSEAAVSEVDVVSGAGFLIRKSLFDRIGGFSREYFMYAEEVELCYRVHRARYKVLHCRASEITHYGGQSTIQCELGFADLAMRDSIAHFLRHTRGRSVALMYRATTLVAALTRMAMLSVRPLFMRSAQRERTLQTIRKWRRIASWALQVPASRNRLGSIRVSTAASDESVQVH